jgi:putative holliday junction resolvase
LAASNLLRSTTRYTDGVKNSENSLRQVSPSETGRTRVLGIDYGRARIGLALADQLAAVAKPMGTLNRINRNEDMRRLREIVRDHGVKQVVVGLPLRLDGTRGEMAEEAERFAERVRKQLGVPVEMLDERLTSWEAERILEEQAGRMLHDAQDGRGKRKQAQPRTSVDAVAAAVILNDYLQQQAAKKSAGARVS